MIEITETIAEDGTVRGTVTQGDRVLRYQINGEVIRQGHDDGIDVIAEVRGVIMNEFGGDFEGLRISVGCSDR